MEAPITVEEDKLFNLFNAQIWRKHYNEIPESNKLLSEQEIVALMNPSRTDWKLRIRLWDLIHKALDQSNDYNKIYTVDIIEGICNKEHLNRRIRQKKYFMSFMFSPIEKFTEEVNTMLSITRDKMWTLINNLQPVNKDGTVDKTHAHLLIKVHQQLVDRKMGAVKQLIEMKKVQLNITGDMPGDDIEVIDSKIKELRPQVEVIETEHGNAQVAEGQE